MNRSKKKLIDTSPNSVVFAFDLHKVIIKPNIYQMVKLMITELGLNSLYILSDTRFWLSLIKDGALPKSRVRKWASKYKNKGITKEFLIKIINTQELNKDLIGLIKKLKHKNYKIFLASNAWKELFENLIKKFPLLNSLFDGFYLPSTEEKYIEKPDPNYYVNLKKYLTEHGQQSKKIIFVDDNRQNIKIAKKEGLTGIHFKNTKSLMKILKNLGFELNQ